MMLPLLIGGRFYCRQENGIPAEIIIGCGSSFWASQHTGKLALPVVD